MADIWHVESLISAITSGPKMIEIFGKLEKLETQLLYPAIKISSKTVHNFSCNLTFADLRASLTIWIIGGIFTLKYKIIAYLMFIHGGVVVDS